MLISWIQNQAVGGGITTVGGGDHVDRASDDPALHGDQHRHPCLFQSRERALEMQYVEAEIRSLSTHLTVVAGEGTTAENAQIHARAEVAAGGGDDDHPSTALIRQLVDDLGELRSELGNHRVELIGARELQVGNPIRFFEFETGVSHGWSVGPDQSSVPNALDAAAAFMSACLASKSSSLRS